MTVSKSVDQGSIPWGHAKSFYLSKVLSGCIRGLGPCGLGSNPSRETKFICLCTLIGSAACLRSRWLGVRIRPKVPKFICPVTLIGSADSLKRSWLSVRI